MKEKTIMKTAIKTQKKTAKKIQKKTNTKIKTARKTAIDYGMLGNPLSRKVKKDELYEKEYARINKKNIAVDIKYQRPIDGKRVEYINQNFKLVLAHVLLHEVETIIDGKKRYFYHCVNGQHTIAGWPSDIIYAQIVNHQTGQAAFIEANNPRAYKSASKDDLYWALHSDIIENGRKDSTGIAEVHDIIKESGFNPCRDIEGGFGSLTSCIYQVFNRYVVKAVNNSQVFKDSTPKERTEGSKQVLRDAIYICKEVFGEEILEQKKHTKNILIGTLKLLCDKNTHITKCFECDYDVNDIIENLLKFSWRENADGRKPMREIKQFSDWQNIKQEYVRIQQQATQWRNAIRDTYLTGSDL